MSKKYNVAVVGGHGLVSVSIIKELYRLNFPLESLTIYGSSEHANEDLIVNGKTHKIKILNEENLEHFDLVFFSTGEDISKEYASKFIHLGAKVIDNSSYFRMDKNVPLVIPEINENELLTNSNIYANPNCTTIMILLAIYPLEKMYGVEKINVSSYQSISGAGNLAMQEYVNESIDVNYKPTYLPSKDVIKKPIYNNVLPIVDRVYEDGYTGEEIKVINESRKILHRADLEINPTCVRVPTLFGHGASIYAICKKKINLNEVYQFYQEYPFLRIKTLDDYPSLKEVRGTHYVDVGRFRIDKFCEYTLNLFATSDNLIRGASYNAVKIALSLLKLGVL